MSTRGTGNEHRDTLARLGTFVKDALTPGTPDLPREIVERIWSERAAQLAEPAVEEEEGERIWLVVLRSGREFYGIGIEHVREIRPATQITRVPRVPEWLAGLTNLSGRIYSVVSLGRFLGLPHDDPGEAPLRGAFLVVVETPHAEVALLADAVVTADEFPLGRLQSTEEIAAHGTLEYVQGVLEWQDGTAMIAVLDLPRLLADERLAIRGEAS